MYGVDGSQDRDPADAPAGWASINLFESAAVGDLDGAGPGGRSVVKYQLDLGQAANLLLVGQNVPYSHRMGAYDLATGRAPGAASR